MARPRDFALTSATAARLAREATREPVPVDARLTGEMTDPRGRHSAHDRLLIASLVDRSVSHSERAIAEVQLAACRDCAQLFDDLAAISAATIALPLPSRPRDFTLTSADAERLRVRGWRRVFAAIGTSRDVFSRPLAVGLTTLGLAGLLVTTIPGALTGQAGAPASLSTVGNAANDVSRGAAVNPATVVGQASAAPPFQAEPGAAAAVAASPEPSAAPAPVPAAEAGSDAQPSEPDGLFVGGEQSPLAGEPDGGAALNLYGKSLAGDEPFGGSATIVIAGLVLLAGVGLFGLRWLARRLRDG